MAVRFRLRKLLSERGMSQTDLQSATGLAYSTINDLFNGKTRRVELETLDALCFALDCSIADLLERVGDKSRNRE